jgi:hypothetical protein
MDVPQKVFRFHQRRRVRVGKRRAVDVSDRASRFSSIDFPNANRIILPIDAAETRALLSPDTFHAGKRRSQ